MQFTCGGGGSMLSSGLKDEVCVEVLNLLLNRN